MALLRPTEAGPGPDQRVLVLVQNMAYRFDRRVQNEAQALLAVGVGVTVICPKADHDEPDVADVDGVVVRSYHPVSATGGVLSYVLEFLVAWLRTAALSWRAHREEGFDLVQACNPPDTYWALGLLWRLRGRPFVYDQHDLCPEVFVDRFGVGSVRNRAILRVLLLLERAAYRVAAHVVSPNESYREVATGRGRVPRERTTVVMSTPDHRIMRRVTPQPDARAGFEHLVVYVGIMGPQDGVDGLLRTVRVLKDQGRRDTRFVLLGYGDCYDELRAMSRELGVDDCVHFTGRVSQEEVRSWLSAADLGITPDPSTPFTERSTMNKTLEYMACELPVVASDLVESRRSAGEAALYVRDEHEAASAITTLLDDPDLRAEMGRAGRARIMDELSWDRFAVDYVAVIAGLLRREVVRGGPRVPAQPGAVDEVQPQPRRR